MISSPSAQIVNAIAESHFLINYKGDRVEAYGPTMGVATAIIALGIVVTAALGPEKKGRKFEAVGPPIEAEEVKDVEKGSMERQHIERSGAGAVDRSDSERGPMGEKKDTL